jgi:hypothetical protein
MTQITSPETPVGPETGVPSGKNLLKRLPISFTVKSLVSAVLFLLYFFSLDKALDLVNLPDDFCLFSGVIIAVLSTICLSYAYYEIWGLERYIGGFGEEAEKLADLEIEKLHQKVQKYKHNQKLKLEEKNGK